MGHERVDDVAGADTDVVVAEAGVALRRLEAFEDLGGDSGGAPGVPVRGRAAADEVAGEEDELGVELVDDVDGAPEEPGLGVLLEVNVGELDESESDEGVGEVADPERTLGDLDLVARVGAAVGREREPGGGGPDEEAAAGDGPRAKLTISRRSGRAYFMIPRVRRCKRTFVYEAR